MVYNFFVKSGIFFFLILFTSSVHAHVQSSVASMHVLVTLPPFCEFVETLLGSSVQTKAVVTNGVCPHHYEWKPSQIADIKRANVFVCLKNDPLLDKILPLLVQNSVVICEVGSTIPSLDSEESYFYDPHLWFSLKNSHKIVLELSDFFQKMIPTKAQNIDQNSKSYCKKILLLDKAFQKMVQKKKIQTFYSAHSSWNYFAKDYNLDIFLMEMNEEMISLYDMKNFIRKFQKSSIKRVFNTTHPYNNFLENFISDIGGKLVIIDAISRNFFETFQKIFRIIEECKVSV